MTASLHCYQDTTAQSTRRSQRVFWQGNDTDNAKCYFMKRLDPLKRMGAFLMPLEKGLPMYEGTCNKSHIKLRLTKEISVKASFRTEKNDPAKISLLG